MQLFFYGFITWLTAQDTLLPILLAKETYSFCLHFYAAFVYVVPQMCCVLSSPLPLLPLILDSLQIPFHVIICRYILPYYCYRFLIIFLSYLKVWKNDIYRKFGNMVQRTFLFLNCMTVSCPASSLLPPNIIYFFLLTGTLLSN